MSLSFGIFEHMKIRLCRKFKPNHFLIIEKTTTTFQNQHEILCDSYLNNEGCNISHRVEKYIRWIPLINEKFKLNFDGSRIHNITASRWLLGIPMELLRWEEVDI